MSDNHLLLGAPCLVDRGIERNGILETVKALGGISVIAYSPFEQSLLPDTFHQNLVLIDKSGGSLKQLTTYRKSGLAKSQPPIDILQTLANKSQRSVNQITLN